MRLRTYQENSRPAHAPACTPQRISSIVGASQASIAKVRVERLLANLGYGKRREVAELVREQRVTDLAGYGLQLGDRVLHSETLLDGRPLDPPGPLALVLHKPEDYVCTLPDDEGEVLNVYDLIPERFGARDPELKFACKLEASYSGLLVFSDDPALASKLDTPKKGIFKVYEVELRQEPAPEALASASRQLASGRMRLDSADSRPLLPIRLEHMGGCRITLATCENRTNQVSRILAALGWRELSIRRTRIGGLGLGELAPGQWRLLQPEDLEFMLNAAADLAPITLEDVMEQKRMEKAVGRDRREQREDAAMVGGRSKQPRRQRRTPNKGSSFREADIEAALLDGEQLENVA